MVDNHATKNDELRRMSFGGRVSLRVPGYILEYLSWRSQLRASNKGDKRLRVNDIWFTILNRYLTMDDVFEDASYYYMTHFDAAYTQEGRQIRKKMDEIEASGDVIDFDLAHTVCDRYRLGPLAFLFGASKLHHS